MLLNLKRLLADNSPEANEYRTLLGHLVRAESVADNIANLRVAEVVTAAMQQVSEIYVADTIAARGEPTPAAEGRLLAPVNSESEILSSPPRKAGRRPRVLPK